MRYQRARELFHAACDMSKAQRADYLESACGPDHDLRNEVEALLARHETDHGALADSKAGVGLAMATPDATPAVPTRIGRYRILAKLGEGGMGTVFEAQQENPRRTVALKVVRPGMLSGPTHERFRVEAHILARLQHAGVAHIYEAGSADIGYGEQPFFAMELIRGRPLTEYCEAHKFSTRERLELLAKVCQAVQHAHQKGVVHRDLKPANILVDDAGQPKILDFGIARAIDSDVHTLRQTKAGQLVGTVPYMSPEQLGGDPDAIDTRSDVYALGVLAFELLTGRLPHNVANLSVPGAARVIMDEEAIPLRSINPKFRGDVEAIVSHALEKRKERRYQSAAELAADLRRYLDDEPITARPISTVYQLRKFAKRNKALVGGVTGIAAALILGLAGTVSFAVRARDARNAEAAQRKRAEQRLTDVRQLANALIFDIYDAIERLSGATAARKTLIDTGLTYLDSLAADAEGDLELQRELAGAYRRLGDIQGKPSDANVGDTAGAVTSYERFRDIARTILAHEPNDRRNHDLLIDAYDAILNIQRAAGNPDTTLAARQQRQAAVEAMYRQFPESEALQRDRAIGYANLARTQSETGQHRLAIKSFRRYLEYISMVIDAHPEDLTSRRNKAVILDMVGAAHAALNEMDQAAQCRREALEIIEQVVQENPDVALFYATLADIREGLAFLFLDLEQPLAALEHSDTAMAIRERAVQHDPDDARARRNLTVARHARGFALEKLGRFEAARIAFEENFETLQALLDANPSYVVLRRDLAIAQERLGRVYLELGDADRAVELVLAAVAAMEALSARDPGNAHAQRDVGLAYRLAGEIHRGIARDDQREVSDRLFHWRTAKTWYEKASKQWGAMETMETLAARDRDNFAEEREAIEECAEAIADLADQLHP